MGKQHRRGRATRLDALRPYVHGTGTGVATTGPSRNEATLAFSWEQVRRRKVGQWGVLYATGAWGFLQGLGYLTQLFGWPNELPRVVALALLTRARPRAAGGDQIQD